jgi:DNA adenine methylase
MKYVGSKARISKYVAPILQKCIDDNGIRHYYEPFCGGLNMMDKIAADVRIGNDIHTELIEMWKHVLSIGEFPMEISEEKYDHVRNNQHFYPAWFIGFVGFMASFGSKYWGGYARGFKEDKVTPRNHSNESIRNIIAQIPNLDGVILFNKDYLDGKDVKEYCVYCDPPYDETTRYMSGKFDHETFWEWARFMSIDNYVFISEYNAPDDFKCIWQKDITTTLKVEKHELRTEKLFVYEKGKKGIMVF